MMTDGTTLVRTLRLQYGEIPMQYDILRCKLRDKVEEDEEMVNGVSSLFAHCLPKLTRREISEAVTGAKSCCLIAVRRARDVVLQQKVKAALQGKKRALLPSVVSWLPHSAPCLPGLTKDSSQEGKGISWHEAKDGTEGSEDEEQIFKGRKGGEIGGGEMIEALSGSRAAHHHRFMRRRKRLLEDVDMP